MIAIKRPVAVLGICLIISLLILNNIDATLYPFLGAALVAVTAVFAIIPKLRKYGYVILCSVTAIAAMISIVMFSGMFVNPVQLLYGKTINITAEILDKPLVSNNSYRYMVNVKNIENSDLRNFKIYLFTDYEISADYYDLINCNAEFSQYETAQGYNYAAARGIYIIAQAQTSEMKITASPFKPPMYYIYSLRDSLDSRLHTFMPSKEADFCSALLLGTKSDLSKDIKESFTDSGVAHILVVSGIHMAIVAYFIFSLIMFFTKKQRLSAIMCCIFVFFYMALTGFAFSVVRSGIVVIFAMLAPVFKRASDSLTSIGFAGIVVTVGNPFSVLDIGFMLTFSATVGIVVLNPLLCRKVYSVFSDKKKLLKFLKPLIDTACISISAVVFTFPIMLMSFGTFCPYFVFTNLLIFWAIAPVIVFTLLCAVISFIPILYFIANGLAFFACVISDYMFIVTHFIASLPYAVINTDYMFVYIWCASTAIFMILAACRIINKKVTVVLLSAIIFITGMFTQLIVDDNMYTLHILPCGTGQTVLLEYKHKLAVLRCCGNFEYEDYVLQYISSLKMDLGCIIADSTDTCSYAGAIASQFNVPVAIAAHNNEEFDRQSVISCIDADEYFKYTVFDAIMLTVEFTDNDSLIKVSLGPSESLICPYAESESVAKYQDCDVYIFESKPYLVDKLGGKRIITTYKEVKQQDAFLLFDYVF